MLRPSARQLRSARVNNQIQIFDEESYSKLEDIDLPRLQLGGDSFSAKSAVRVLLQRRAQPHRAREIESTKPIRNPFAIVRAPVTAARP